MAEFEPINKPSWIRSKTLGSMPNRTIAIGDIHGCSLALKKLLELVAPEQDDRIVTLGDYIDRGPDSRDVIEQLIALSTRCELRPLLGNHELMMLASRNDASHIGLWEQCGGRETLDSYGGAISDVPSSHWDFVSNCRPHFETSSHIFIHANYVSHLPVEELSEADLFWRHLQGAAATPHESGKQVILGHTPQSGKILDLGHVVCIDTLCFGEGCLTAYDVHSGECWQADKLGRQWHPEKAAPQG
jgi:serine/threonine protein phosphatase 1